MSQVGRLTPLQIALAKEESNEKQEARRAGGRWWLNSVYYGNTGQANTSRPSAPAITGGGLTDINTVAEKVKKAALRNAKARDESAQAAVGQPLSAKTGSDLLADQPAEGNAMEIARLETLYQKIDGVAQQINEAEGPANKPMLQQFKEAIAAFIAVLTATDLAALNPKAMTSWESKTAGLKNILSVESKNNNATATTALTFLTPLQARLALVSQAIYDKNNNLRDSTAAVRLRQYASSGDQGTSAQADLDRVARTNDESEAAMSATLAARQTEKDAQAADKKQKDVQRALEALANENGQMMTLKKSYMDDQQKIKQISVQYGASDKTPEDERSYKRDMALIERSKLTTEQKITTLAAKMVEKIKFVKAAGVTIEDDEYDTTTYDNPNRGTLWDRSNPAAFANRPDTPFPPDAEKEGENAKTEAVAKLAKETADKRLESFMAAIQALDVANTAIKTTNERVEELHQRSLKDEATTEDVIRAQRGNNANFKAATQRRVNALAFRKKAEEALQASGEMQVELEEVPDVVPMTIRATEDKDDNMKSPEEDTADKKQAKIYMAEARAQVTNMNKEVAAKVQEFSIREGKLEKKIKDKRAALYGKKNPTAPAGQVLKSIETLKQEDAEYQEFVAAVDAEAAKVEEFKERRDKFQLDMDNLPLYQFFKPKALPEVVNKFKAMAERLERATPARDAPPGTASKRKGISNTAPPPFAPPTPPSEPAPKRAAPNPEGSGDRVATEGKLNTDAVALAPDFKEKSVLLATKRKKRDPEPEEEEQEEEEQQPQEEPNAEMDAAEQMGTLQQKLPGVEATKTFGVQAAAPEREGILGAGNTRKKTKFAALEKKLQKI